MSEAIIVIHGEAYVTLRAAAACYHVEFAFVREVYELGLLGPGEPFEGADDDDLAVAAEMLDRLAEVVRLHQHHEMDIFAIAAVLERGR